MRGVNRTARVEMGFADIHALVAELDTRPWPSPAHTSSRSADDETEERGDHATSGASMLRCEGDAAKGAPRRVEPTVAGRRRPTARGRRRNAPKATIEESVPVRPPTKRPRRASSYAGSYVEGPERDEMWIKATCAGWDAMV